MRKYTGIKAVAGETARLKKINGYTGYSGRVQICYDMETDKVWCQYYADQTSYSVYDDTNIITIIVDQKMTMGDIKELLEMEMEEKEKREEWAKQFK